MHEDKAIARSLDQILAELNPSYSGSENILSTRLNAIPGETQTGIAQADAKLAEANTNILDSSRRRGLGFSGIPIGEQAKFAATEYAPAIANLKSTQANKELSLQESLQQLGRDKRGQAQSIFDSEVSQDFQNKQFQEQIRQFNESMAAQERARQATAASADLSRYFNSPSNAPKSTPTNNSGATYGYTNGQDVSGGFYFRDGGGNIISPAKYAQITGTPLVDLINQMAQQGDSGARNLMKGPGVDTSNVNFKPYFAWDLNGLPTPGTTRNLGGLTGGMGGR